MLKPAGFQVPLELQVSLELQTPELYFSGFQDPVFEEAGWRGMELKDAFLVVALVFSLLEAALDR